ncbi:unnamed protein product [Polarella glacialis]|uniref:Uncharacterized protein n=1 Tax=Polarella glacialis TaxID=89957 RepID=A0A813DCC3_POLGL|nr:unnamed protein product [Polarella glacialis]
MRSTPPHVLLCAKLSGEELVTQGALICDCGNSFKVYVPVSSSAVTTQGNKRREVSSASKANKTISSKSTGHSLLNGKSTSKKSFRAQSVIGKNRSWVKNV